MQRSLVSAAAHAHRDVGKWWLLIFRIFPIGFYCYSLYHMEATVPGTPPEQAAPQSTTFSAVQVQIMKIFADYNIQCKYV